MMKRILLYLLLLLVAPISAQCQLPNNGVVGPKIAVADLFTTPTLDELDRFILVNFDPNIYHSSGGGVQSGDITLTFTQNSGSGGTATACVISTITNSSGGALVGGEATVKVNLTITGTVHGEETIEIKASSAGTMKDVNDRFVTAAGTTGLVALWPTYHTNYQTVLSYAITNNISTPNPAQRLIDNTFYTAMASYWSSFDALYLLADNLNDRNFALINVINPGTFTITTSGSPVWSDNIGTKSDGSSYLNTHFAPATNGSHFAQADGALWVYSNNSSSQNTWVVGAAGVSTANTGRVGLKPLISGPNLVSIANRNSTGTSISNSNGKGLFTVSRSSSTDEKTYQDGTLLNTLSAAGSARSDKNVYINCSNENGTASSFNTVAYVSLVGFSSNNQSNISAISSAMNTWLSATTTPSPPTDHGRFYVLGGQSNINGGNSASTFPDSLKNAITNCYYLSTITHLWVPLDAGTSGVSNSTSPLFSLAYDEHVKHPSDKLYFVLYGVGGSPITSWQTGGTNRNTLVSYINTAKSILTVDNYEPFYWFQGEEDAKTSGDATAYATREQGVIADFFSVIGTDRAIVWYINTNLPSGAFPYTSTVNGAKTSNNSGSFYGASGALITTSDLTWNPDNIHLSTAGAITAGKRASASTTP